MLAEVGMCRRCGCVVSGTVRVATRLKDAVYRLLQKPLCGVLLVLYAVTFCLLLPAFCSHLRFSQYYRRPNTVFSQEMMRKENTERINSAMR